MPVRFLSAGFNVCLLVLLCAALCFPALSLEAEEGNAVVTLMGENLPNEGMCGLLIIARLPTGVTVTDVKVGDAVNNLHMTWQQENYHIAVFLDGESNDPCPPRGVLSKWKIIMDGGELLALPEILQCIAYTYDGATDSMREIPVRVSLCIEGSESENEKNTETAETIPTAHPMPIPSVSALSSDPVYVGCQETPVYGDTYRIRFLFLIPETYQFTSDQLLPSVMLMPRTGQGKIPIKLNITRENYVTEIEGYRANIRRVEGFQWLIYTFDGIPRNGPLTFEINTGRGVWKITYEDGHYV